MEKSKKTSNEKTFKEVEPLKIEEDLMKPEELSEVTEPKVDPHYTLEVIKEEVGTDIFRVPNPLPGYHYRYLNTKESNLFVKTGNLLLAKGGWQLCDKEHCLKIGFDEKGIGADGHRRIANDLILAFMPEDLYQKKELHKRKEANEPMSAIQRLLSEGDPNNPDTSGIGHSNMRGIQTKKQLGM